MDIHTANQMLQNVFASCNTPPNTIPFDKLMLRQKARIKYITGLKYSCLLCLLITLVTPFVFTKTSGSLTIKEHSIRSIELVNHYIAENQFHIFLSGTDLHLEKSYITSEDGTVYSPTYSDNSEGEVVFPYPGGEINIYIYEDENNYLQILLTPEK